MKMHVLAVIALFAWAGACVHTSVALAQTENVDVDPAICWWRNSVTSVRVGETFTVVLTCSFLQTEAARVVADQSRLEPSVVQLPPFDLVGGSRAKDLVTADRRFVQYMYQLRVVAENVFAAELALPPLEITYRVESRVARRDSVAGRDLTYALPPLTMRVLSLVPDTADDIREAPVATFSEIERVGSRGTMLRAAAGVLLAVGVLSLVLAVVNALRGRLAARRTSKRVLPGAVVLRGVRRELASIQEHVRSSGWTSDLAGRALAALRIVAAYATARPVTQQTHAGGHGFSPAEGQVVVRERRGARTVVSSAVATTDDQELREALARFAAVRYGRESRFDSGLDDVLDATILRAERLTAGRPLAERLWMR